MPQLNQLADVAYSQFFWLAIVLAVIYFGIGHAMLPKIQSTVDARNDRIAEDLEAAEAARAAADDTEEAYRTRMNESRAAAMKVIQEAKAASARATGDKVRKADAAIRERTEAAEARLGEATQAALADIESVAVEAAQEMTAKLAGIRVGRDEAAQAVREVVHG